MKALLKNVTNYRTLTRKFIVKNDMSGNTPPPPPPRRPHARQQFREKKYELATEMLSANAILHPRCFSLFATALNLSNLFK